jgi:hypothetical protein
MMEIVFIFGVMQVSIGRTVEFGIQQTKYVAAGYTNYCFVRQLLQIRRCTNLSHFL